LASAAVRQSEWKPAADGDVVGDVVGVALEVDVALGIDVVVPPLGPAVVADDVVDGAAVPSGVSSPPQPLITTHTASPAASAAAPRRRGGVGRMEYISGVLITMDRNGGTGIRRLRLRDHRVITRADVR
jgi:hypothetical protein